MTLKFKVGDLVICQDEADDVPFLGIVISVPVSAAYLYHVRNEEFSFTPGYYEEEMRLASKLERALR